MAPEEALGHAVDQRVDIYAFGLICYDMLLGPRESLHGGLAPLDALMAHRSREIPDARLLLTFTRNYAKAIDTYTSPSTLQPPGHRHDHDDDQDQSSEGDADPRSAGVEAAAAKQYEKNDQDQ